MRPDRVFLVAPWINPGSEEDTGDFFDITVDAELASRTNELVIINSDDDHHSIQQTAALLRDQIKGSRYVELHGCGHFYDDRRMQFPELAKELFGSY